MNDRSFPFAPRGPLADVAGFPRLMRDWVAGDAPFGNATDAWRACLKAPPPDAPAPAWSDAVWRESWWEVFAADLPDAEAVALCRGNVSALAAGEADVIVTGQQPGFLGGPLYTLYKAATCVAAAAARSEAGRPTVPLFWSGDDDDDLREAFAPLLYDPRRATLLKAVTPETPAGRSVGALPAATAGAGEAAWLEEQASRSDLAGLLSRTWTAALAEGATWGVVQRRALLHLLGRHGLLIVSGDDPRLHAAAAPLYTKLLAKTSVLSAAAAASGERLVADGYHAQIGAESLSSPFSVAGDGRRRRLGEADAPPDDPSLLRPGVLLRSPVQDWLFRPAGVVAGPAEIAYLKQTESVYEALALPRPPLVPRLFCALVDAPQASPTRGRADDDTLSDILARLDASASTALTEALQASFEFAPDEAQDLAAPNLRRWSARNRSLFERLARSRGAGAEGPAWVAPGKGRQERVLATHWAAALWGAPLVAAVLAAARAHLDAGASGAWSDWHIVVDSGKDGS